MLKKWVIFGLTAALISGCSANSNETEKKEEPQPSEQKQEESAKSSQDNAFKDSPQAPDDTKLTQINKTFEDADGVITLLKHKEVNEKKNADPLSLTIADVKVLQYKPSVDLIDFFHGYTHEETEFPYVRVNVIVKNNGDEPVHFAPISEIKTDQGETVTWKEDFYLEKMNGTIEPGEEKTGSFGFIIDETEPKKLKEISITSSEVINKNKKKMADPISFKIQF